MPLNLEPGIYRTTKYLPGHEAQVGPDQIVLVRTDAQFAPASVLLPSSNVHNQWRFSMPGIRVPESASDWASSLVRLPHEGFYRLNEEMDFGEGGKWLVGAILQLGYNRRGEPLLFIARRRTPLAENDLFFSKQGIKVDDSFFRRLDPLAWHEEPDPTQN